MFMVENKRLSKFENFHFRLGNCSVGVIRPQKIPKWRRSWAPNFEFRKRLGANESSIQTTPSKLLTTSVSIVEGIKIRIFEYFSKNFLGVRMNKVNINLKLQIKKKFDLKLMDKTSEEHVNLATEVLENFTDDFQKIAKEKDLTVEKLSVSFEQEATVKIWFNENFIIIIWIFWVTIS